MLIEILVVFCVVYFLGACAEVSETLALIVGGILTLGIVGLLGFAAVCVATVLR